MIWMLFALLCLLASIYLLFQAFVALVELVIFLLLPPGLYVTLFISGVIMLAMWS